MIIEMSIINNKKNIIPQQELSLWCDFKCRGFLKMKICFYEFLEGKLSLINFIDSIKIN